VECDYKCLHPNIAMNLYKGNSQFLTHSEVAQHLNLDELIVKKEHLSFFNKPVNQMIHSPLWNYYKKKEPKMLENLVNDKMNNSILPLKEKHKITSHKLFKKEVNIMSRVIEKLNIEGIYVMYVYDALYCQEKHIKIVCDVMNEVAIHEGIFTNVKRPYSQS
jgi:hypothetical protein